MRALRVIEFVSLDGVMQSPHEGGDTEGGFRHGGWDHYADVGSDATGKASINTFNVGIGMRF